MVPTMAALSESLWTPLRRTTYRAPGRLAVIAWIAAVGALPRSCRSHGRRAARVVASGAAAIAALTLPSRSRPRNRRDLPPPPPDDGRPRVAVIVRGLALSDTTTAAAIARLPPTTLGLSPMAARPEDRRYRPGERAMRSFSTPVRPPGYPANDAGPKAIVASLTPSEKRRAAGLVASNGRTASGFVFARQPGAGGQRRRWTAFSPIRAFRTSSGRRARRRGRRRAGGAARIDVTIDAAATHDIDLALERLEALARRNRSAIGLAGPHPVTVDRLAAWAPIWDRAACSSCPPARFRFRPPPDRSPR